MLEARQRQHGMSGNPDTSQLLLIVSDGRGLFLEGMEVVKTAVRQAREANVFLVFVVLDNPLNKVRLLYAIWTRGYKTFFMLNSTEHEISTAHKTKMLKKIKIVLAYKLSDVVFIMLINFKMPTVVGILTFMSMINFFFSWVEHEKSFMTSEPDYCSCFSISINMILFKYIEYIIMMIKIQLIH